MKTNKDLEHYKNECADLTKDKSRMDWLEEKMWFVRANVMLHDEVPPYTVKTCDGLFHAATVRAAIDAGMREDAK